MQTKNNFSQSFGQFGSSDLLDKDSEWNFDNDHIFSNLQLNMTRNFNQDDESDFKSKRFQGQPNDYGPFAFPGQRGEESNNSSNQSSPTNSVAERYFNEFESSLHEAQMNKNGHFFNNHDQQLNQFGNRTRVQEQQLFDDYEDGPYNRYGQQGGRLQYGQSNRPQQYEQNQFVSQRQQFAPKPRLQPTSHQMQYRANQGAGEPQRFNGGYQQQQKPPPIITPQYQQVMAKYNIPLSQCPIAGAAIQQKIPEPMYFNDNHSPRHASLFQSGPGALSLSPVVTEDSVVYMVQFKMEFRYFVLSPLLIEAVEMNSFVIVEADKGEDLGLVVELLSMDTYIERRKKEQLSGLFEESERVLRHITKLANRFDLALLPEKYRDESVVIDHANEVVKRVLVLPMLIVNAEYQFDRTRLTIHYTANTRVDFRELVSKLFSIFRTCVWLKKVNSNLSFDTKPYAVLALRTGQVISPPSPTNSLGAKKLSGLNYSTPSPVTVATVNSTNSRGSPPVRPSYVVDFSEEEVLAQYIPDDDDEDDLIFAAVNAVFR